MTKNNEEIIIHGVDVSRCKKYKHEIERCNTLLKNLCFGSALDCTHEKSKNCYYKQLKRKEQECERSKQTLTEIKEVLQFYSNSTIGVDKGNGIFEFEVFNDNVLGGKLTCYYDPNPAKEALQKINEVENV